MEERIVTDRWRDGLIRHLLVDEHHRTDVATARRMACPDGSQTIFYTLCIHPTNLPKVEEIRRNLEVSDELGGFFRPEER